MSKIKNLFLGAFIVLLATSCASDGVKVAVENTTALERQNEMIEVNMDDVAARLQLADTAQVIVLDATGNQLPHQITYDGKLIFQASVAPNATSVYTIKVGTPEVVEVLACGRQYPERVDDIAWENDLTAYRMYGPALQATGERAFGYDVWVKSVKEPVVEARYASELNPETMEQIAKLRKTNPQAADELYRSVSYHVDHGNGLDCYKVGPTLGGGATALVVDGEIVYPYCYKTYEILDNGPLRFTVKAVYTQAKFYERYTKNTEYLAEIAVLNPSDIFELERPSNVGVVRMLNELKYSYDFIDINADFKKYKLIILPDDIKVDSALKKKLSKYLKSGGKILSTGTSGLNVKGNSFALEEYAFIRFSGFDKNNVPYFVFCEDKDRVEWSCYGSSILMKNLSGKVFGDYLKPYNNRHYDGVHGYFYTPPKEYTEYSVSVCSENICHISFPVFKTYAETFLTAQRKLVKLALETLVKDPLVRAENIPSSIRLTMTRNDEHTLLHVRTTYPERKHLKGVIEEHVLYKGGDKIQVKGNFKKAISVKDNKEIKSQTVGGYTELVLPEVMGYTMIKLIG